MQNNLPGFSCSPTFRNIAVMVVKKNGLAILPDAKWLEDGALVPFSRPAKPEKDKKAAQ